MMKIHPKLVIATTGLLLLLLLLIFYPGLWLRPVGRRNAATLTAWLAEQQFSSWESFKDEGREPAYPVSPDGMTLGSPNIFAALAADPKDLTSLDVFWADKRTTRPFPREVKLALRLRGRGLPDDADLLSLADFPQQILRRVRHTSISVSEASHHGVKLTTVDFAPMSPDQNFLVRWFLVENYGDSTRSVDLVLQTLLPGEARRLGRRACRFGEQAALVSDISFRPGKDNITASFGRLRPGKRASGVFLFTGSADPAQLDRHIDQARTALLNLLSLLEDTKKDWTNWCQATPLETGDRRMDDLLDSILCLIRTHIGADAIHTGSLRYPHNRAWIRDTYWVQRALLELGREEGLLSLDFFHRAWRASGIASSYEVATLRPHSYGFQRVELPHYLILMVRDAERLAGLDPAPYWDMVKGCMDYAALPPNALQPMNGDETWILATPIRELDSLLDNSWLLVASAEYAADLAARMNEPEKAKHFQNIASRARAALIRFTPRAGQAEWPALGYGADGSLDLSLSPSVVARGPLLGVLPATDPLIASGLTASWNRLGFERGVRTHPNSATMEGGTPGYLLAAAAELPNAPFVGDLIESILKQASATGCVWEYHDIYDPTWGGEKRRLWDSAVILLGLTQSLFDIRENGGELTFLPKNQPESLATTSPTPPFDASALLAQAGPSLLLHANSPRHATRLARELVLHRNERFAFGDYKGQPPADVSAIIVSRTLPPTGWRHHPRGYWVREWDGPTQLWVRNVGHVFLDTDPLLVDLLTYLPPARPEPLPFPDTRLKTAALFGERPAGTAEISATCLFQNATGALDLSGGETEFNVSGNRFTVRAEAGDEPNILKLTVTAGAPRENPTELSVTLPADYWLVRARDMTGHWNRVVHPAGQHRLADGRIRLCSNFAPSNQSVSINFELNRLTISPSS